MIYSCDFETTTDIQDCRVWAIGVYEINYQNFQFSNSIDWFISFMQLDINVNSTYYFHNLKFDGEFIIYYLLKHNFTHVNSIKNMPPNTFATLISDAGQFYSMTICFKNNHKAKILDSLKVLPFKVEQIAKDFGLAIRKGSIDYDAPRKIGHELTNDEIAYLKNDCEIVGQALKLLLDQGDNKMTTAANAFMDFKSMMGQKRFLKCFPPPDYDADIRQAYKGGFTYVPPWIREKDIGKGIVLDVNSLYPWVMRTKILPYGEGIFFKGKYKKDAVYNLYIQMLSCQFKLKEKHIPTIQIKNYHSIFIPNEYLESSHDEDVTLCLTSIDLKLFFKHYNIFNIEYLSGWKFKSSNNLFSDYIDKWYKIKMEASQKGNKAMKTLAKLKLNSLYGRFALNPKVVSKIPYLKEDIVKYRMSDPEIRLPIYIPVAAFITAWARHTTISTAQLLYDRFCYADTDSLHLMGTEVPTCINVDPYELGAWKIENTFSRARFLRQKCYIEDIAGKLQVTCAGMPPTCYENVTWENFQLFGKFPGKLKPTHTKGGIVLEPIDFTIRA